MFWKRLISGIVLVIITVVMNVLGGPFMEALLLFISVVGLREFYKAAGVSSKEGRMNTLELTGMIGAVLYYLALCICYLAEDGLSAPSLALKPMEVIFSVIVIIFLVFMAEYVLCFPRFEAHAVMGAFFGFFYVPVMLSFIFLTRAMDEGEYLVWLIYIASWVCDTAAYCTGMLIGRHKLAPVLSPKKSVEGSLGGIAGSALVAFLFALILSRKSLIPSDMIWLFVLIGAVGSVVSQIGDLAASAFKRNYEIKDYGSLIPGHGGILDRFDSVIFVAPMIFLLARFLGQALVR